MEYSDEPLIHDQFERGTRTPVLLFGGAGSRGGYPERVEQPSAVDDGRRRGGWGHTAPREASAMLAERYAARAGAPARTRGSTAARAGARAFGGVRRVPQRAPRV